MPLKEMTETEDVLQLGTKTEARREKTNGNHDRDGFAILRAKVLI